ncbi:MAG: hypothetical protein Q8P41_21945 [Pseudomonadota bacterium]|nr:hypothetical protein [Pseudomonadota bacterium]
MRTDPPRFVVSDLPNPAAAVGFAGVCLLWLGARWAFTGFGGAFEALDVIAATVPVALLGLLAFGARRIEADGHMLRIHRKGRVVFERPLADIVGFSGFGGMSWLRFRDGARLWFPAFGADYGPAAASLVTWLGPEASGPAGTVSIHAGQLRFPDGCVACGAPATGTAHITARRGIHLVVFAFHVTRAVPVPACPSCRRKHRALSLLWNLGPIVALVSCLFLPMFTPIRGTPVFVLAGLAAAWLLYALNRGDERADWTALGVRSGLAADGTTVHLRFRDPTLALAVAVLSAANPPTETPSAMPTV